jgi:hypothetical protein
MLGFDERADVEISLDLLYSKLDRISGSIRDLNDSVLLLIKILREVEKDE